MSRTALQVESHYIHREDLEFVHGRIETRTFHVCDGLDIITDKDKWCGKMSIIVYVCDSVKKATCIHICEKDIMLVTFRSIIRWLWDQLYAILVNRKHALGAWTPILGKTI